jgi:hypothetical protein
MLPSLKRKRDAAAAVVLPAWHPNFRNFEKLPDTKVVRTAFFTNIAAVSVSAVVLFWFGFGEYQLHNVQGEIEEVQAQIARDQAASNLAVKKYKTFQATATRLAEIDAFLKSKPLVSPLLLRLGETLPESVAIDEFDLDDKGLRLTGAVRGSPDLAAGHASAYRDRLRDDEKLKEIFDSVTLKDLKRDPQSGRMVVEILLAAKSAGGKKS